MKKFLSSIRIGNLAFAVAALVIGFYMLIKPDSATTVICRIIGVAVLVCGAALIIGSLTADRYKALRITGIVMGAILAILGIVIEASPAGLAKFIFIFVGVMIIVNGILDIQACASVSLFHGAGLAFLLLSALTVVMGVAVILHPFEAADVVMRFAGISLIIDAVIDLLVVGAVSKAARRAIPPVATVEADAVEVE